LSPSFLASRVRVSAVSGSTRALARGAVRLARRLSLNRFIGEAPMKTAEAAALPGTAERPEVRGPTKVYSRREARSTLFGLLAEDRIVL